MFISARLAGFGAAVAAIVALGSALPVAAQGVAAAAAAPSPAGNTLKIGVIGPFTGASSDFGVPMLNGIQRAVEEINAVGGYLAASWRLCARTTRPTSRWA